jgi:hypothetical protein
MNVACKDLAGLGPVNDNVAINFELNRTLTIDVSQTELYHETLTFPVTAITNKDTECYVSVDGRNAKLMDSMPTQLHKTDLTVAGPGTYRLDFDCNTGFGTGLSIEQVKATISVTADNTPPWMLYASDNSTLVDDVDFSYFLDRLRVAFLGTDNETDVNRYYYQITDDTSSDVIKNWTPTTKDDGQFHYITQLNLSNESTYSIQVIPENNVGLNGTMMSSDGVTVNTDKTPPQCSNGVLDAGETDVDCGGICPPCDSPGSCGDSIVGAGETCDGLNFEQLTCTDYDTFVGGNLACASCQVNTAACVVADEGVCGDGDINSGETCEGNDFAGSTCLTYDTFIGGSLSCSSCIIDTVACVVEDPGSCGDGDINTGESCDGNNFEGLTCEDYDTFVGGTLSCSGCDVGTTACVVEDPGFCGDGNINTGESCDGSNFGGTTCTDYDRFTGGSLSCDSNCQLSTNSCTGGTVGVCGDGVVNRGESCDGNDLSGLTCQDYGLEGGTLGCNSQCGIDTSGCGVTNPGVCGDGEVNSGEDCDGNDLSGQTCQAYGFDGGTLKCNSACDIDTSSCGNTNPGFCGDGEVNSGETCDGDDLSGRTCQDYGFEGGTLGCSSRCDIDTSGCGRTNPGVCGDGVVNSGESCDGDDLSGLTCQDYGFESGSLSCSSVCGIDTSACTGGPKPHCGNGVIDAGEQCEGDDLGRVSSCTDFGGYTGGNISCNSSCKFEMSACTGGTVGVCGDGDINIGEQCDGTTFGRINSCTWIDRFTGGTFACDDNCQLDTLLCSVPTYACEVDEDCATNYCKSGFCSWPSCNDEVKNGDESDIDCGGNLCGACDVGLTCAYNSDCQSDLCEGGICTENSCKNNVLDRYESDVDCGGACSTKCIEGQTCNENNDCIIGANCIQNTCTVIEDADGDGIPDEIDQCPGTPFGEQVDEFGCANSQKFSCDDAISDAWRIKYFGSVLCGGRGAPDADPDGDGRTNLEEFFDGTDPTVSDKEPFPWLWLLLFLLFITLIALGGWYYYKHPEKFKRKPKPKPQAAPVRMQRAIRPTRRPTPKPKGPHIEKWVSMDELKQIGPKDVSAKTFDKLDKLVKGDLPKEEHHALLKAMEKEGKPFDKLRSLALENMSKKEKAELAKKLDLLKQGKLSPQEKEALFKKLRITAVYYEKNKAKLAKELNKFARGEK